MIKHSCFVLSLIQGRQAFIHPWLLSNEVVITIVQCEANSLKVFIPMSLGQLFRNTGISSLLRS